MTNTPIFEACKPTFTISGLEGHQTNASILPVSYPGGYASVAANGSASTAVQLNAIFWDSGAKFTSPPSATRVRFGITQTLPLKYDGGLMNSDSSLPTDSSLATLEFSFTIFNQARFQDAPSLTASAKYSTSKFDVNNGGVWDAQYKTDALWNVPTVFDVQNALTWQTQFNRAIYVGDDEYRDEMEKRPLFIRQARFPIKNIGQTNPWPAGSNTIKVKIKNK
jgi:hypothetical protein